MTQLRYAVVSDIEVQQVILVGELTADTAPVARMALLKSLAREPQVILCDVSALECPQAMALTVFSAVALQASTWPGTTLVLHSAGPALLAMLDDVDIRRYVRVRPTLEEALALAHELSPSPRVRLHLEAAVGAPREARQLVSSACRDWALADLADRAAVVISELVTNSVRHARSSVDVSVSCRNLALHLAVADHSSQQPVLQTTSEGEGGRGLMLVEALTSTWGVNQTDEGKVVWAIMRSESEKPRPRATARR